MERDNQFEWNQFIKLGDMMGDGLHHEPDGAWITKEYNKLARLLVPEIREAEKLKRAQKAISVNASIHKLIQNKPCPCGGKLKQSRSGSVIMYCETCGKRYKAIKNGKRNNNS